jgi:S-layer homology domain
MKRILLATLCTFVFFAIASAETYGSAWSDVPKEHWAYEDIMDLWQMGVVSGKSQGVFDPNAYVTKAEFTKMAMEITGVDENELTDGCSLGNMDEQGWFYNYMYTFCALDLNQSPLTSNFADANYPNDEIEREDAAIVLIRLINPNEYIEETDGERFQDVDTDDGTWPYINTAGYYEIFTGYEEDGHPFKPHDELTRAEAAAIINRAYNAFYAEGAPYADDVTSLD